jgi:uncharacterized phage-associated protein
METKYTAQQIAQWFINRSVGEATSNQGEYLSNMKLQKLLYYAQGCYLALKDTPLFNEKILAWEHGPVVVEVYNNYKKNLAINTTAEISIDPATSSILNQVYNIFGQYSAWKLRDMTHNEKPWKNTKRNDEIKQEIIKDYFLEKYVA